MIRIDSLIITLGIINNEYMRITKPDVQGKTYKTCTKNFIRTCMCLGARTYYRYLDWEHSTSIAVIIKLIILINKYINNTYTCINR